MEKEVEDKLYNSFAAKQWQNIGVRHHHGICLPLFSLHSEKSCGVGDFFDLYPLIDWCKEIGFDVIQLLPLNDTGLDISPYNAISSMAINPVHISLENLPFKERVPGWEERIKFLKQWNHTERVNYPIVKKLKNEFFDLYFHNNFGEISKHSDFENFIKKNSWLESYALFCCLKEKYHWSQWESWPNPHKSPSEGTYKTLISEFEPRINYYQLIQYLCFDQLSQLKNRAQQQGIFIKGDIPILISPDSVDVWANRRFFLTQFSAGAPPDMFSEMGQNWGFPVYDWEALEKHRYEWWVKRLRYAQNFYHIYRIDHVVGFFRIWAIPRGKQGIEGHFIPEEGWIEHGKKIMQMMLLNSSMLPIGEDLGVVPPSVRKCLYELGICGTKVMRWERRWDEDRGFIPISQYNPESMTTVSTHDSDTLQLWWKHSAKEAKEFCDYKHWDYQPILSLDRHAAILRDSHHSNSLFHINLLQEYLALFPHLVSSNPLDERINIPGKIIDTNWTYRFRPKIEEITTHQDLKNTMRYLIS